MDPTTQATATIEAADPDEEDRKIPYDLDDEAPDADDKPDLTREHANADANEQTGGGATETSPTEGEGKQAEVASTETTDATDIEVTEFPITLQFGDKAITFDTEDAYNTFVENAENQSKAWGAIHDRNRKDKAEVIAEQQRVAAIERELAELKAARAIAAAPVKPTPPDLTLLDPDSPNYNPKVGLAQQAKFNADTLAYLEGKTAEKAAPAPPDPNETPVAREQREIREAEDRWRADHADITDAQRAEIDRVTIRIATERMAELARTNRTIRPEFDVPDIYDRAYREVTGKEAARKQADPKESVKSVARVIRIATARAKSAPKASKASPPVEPSIPDDPFSDDVSPADYKRLLAAGKIKSPLDA